MSDLYFSGFKMPDLNINFHDANQNTIGSFFIKDNKLQFEGDADESAKIFLESLKKQFNQHIDELVEQRLTDKVN